MLFNSLRSVALTMPSAATVRNIWIMSFRLIEPSASRLWTSCIKVTFCGVEPFATTDTVAMPESEPLLAVTEQLPVLLGAVNMPDVLTLPPTALEANAG